MRRDQIKVDSSNTLTTSSIAFSTVHLATGIEAPRIQSKVPIGDANTMAEYSTVPCLLRKYPTSRMLCVESDSYLADAASAHQVLMLVLQQPAKVSRRLRQRLYDIPGQESEILQNAKLAAWPPRRYTNRLTTRSQFKSGNVEGTAQNS